jgi:hypothetical protein
MMRKWLINRFTITFGTLAVAIGGWNIYVAGNNGGLLTGQVVGPDGRSVANAQVQLSEQTIVSLNKLASTTTDEQGRFEFLRHDRFSLVLTAKKDGVGSSGRHRVRLLFRNQDFAMDEPVLLKAP